MDRSNFIKNLNMRTAGPSGPEHPFPLRIRGDVIQGFGRGSKVRFDLPFKIFLLRHDCSCWESQQLTFQAKVLSKEARKILSQAYTLAGRGLTFPNLSATKQIRP